MGISIKELQTLGSNRNKIKLLGGESGIQKDVKSISVMEVPDFAEKCNGDGLFVLTTFSFIQGNEIDMNEIFKKLSSKNIAGLLIKVNRYIKEVPDSIIDFSDFSGTPLFRVDENIFFGEIIRDVTSLIINKQYNFVTQLNEQHDLLYNGILNGESLFSFINRMGSLLNLSCYCFDAMGHLLNSYSVDSMQNGNQSQISKNLFNLIDIKEHSSNISNKSSYVQVVDGETYTVFNCIAKNKLLGFFVVRSKDSLNDLDSILTQQMRSFISIKLLEGQLELEVKNRMTKAIFDEVFLKHNTDELLIKEKLRLLHMEPKENYCILYIASNHITKDNFDINELNAQMKMFNSIIRKYSYDSMVENISSSFVALITFDKFSHKKNIIYEILSEFEKKKEIEENFKISISSIERDYKKLPDAYNEAQEAMNWGLLLHKNKNQYHYDDFLSFRLVINSLGSKEHEELTRTIIDPLISYDQKNSGELIETLKACLLNDTLDEASKILFIHISTLRYRLEKIKMITGVNYFDSNGKYLLMNAFYICLLNSKNL